MGCVSKPPSRPPRMPLAIDIWTNGSNVSTPPRVATVCQLVVHAPEGVPPPTLTPPPFFQAPVIYLPAGTDIRGTVNGDPPDIVALPAGTDRYYSVLQVEDRARGFLNAHRVAWLTPINKGAPPAGSTSCWSFPYA